MKTQNSDLITDSQSLVGALTRFRSAIPVYDDGFGSLFIHRDSLGISGIVRAQSWGDAYSICEDEFFPEAQESVEELRAEYNFDRKSVKIIHPINEFGQIDTSIERAADISDYKEGCLRDGQFVRWETIETPCADADGWAGNELFQEAYGFRPNGANAKDTHKHGIYAKDLNGDSLEPLTLALMAELEITLQIEENA